MGSFITDVKTLQQACQTQNTVRAAKGVLKPKKLSAGRNKKKY